MLFVNSARDHSEGPGDIAAPEQLGVEAINNLRAALLTRRGPEFVAALRQLTPPGDVYSYIGLLVERQRHSRDVWAQLMDMADRNRCLFTGNANDSEDASSRLALPRGMLESRAVLLAEHLLEAEANAFAAVASEEEHILEGLCPLKGLLSDSTVVPLQLHRDDSKGLRRQVLLGNNVRSRLAALCLFCVQMLSPALLIGTWRVSDSTNFAVELLFGRLCFVEPWQATNVEDVISIFLSAIILAIVIFLARARADEEIAKASGLTLLPIDTTWCVLGNIANANCCLFVPVAFVFLLWSGAEMFSKVSSVVMLISLLQMGSLHGPQGSFIGVSNDDFRALSAWTRILLTQCPVDLSEITNRRAKSLDHFWQLSSDTAGRLWNHTTLRPCCTRMMIDRTGTSSDRTVEVSYQVELAGDPRDLPDCAATICRDAWIVVKGLLNVAQLTLPFLYVLLWERSLEAAVTPPAITNTSWVTNSTNTSWVMRSKEA